MSTSHSKFSQEYLKEFQNVVDNVTDINLSENERAVALYIESLKKFAKETERMDLFSKAKLFREEEYQLIDLSELKKLISSVQHLIENVEYRKIIDKHISSENLRALIVELMTEYGKKEEERLKKIWLNDLIADIKKKLRRRTAATVITEVDLYKIAIETEKIDKFVKITKQLQCEQEVMRREIQGFKVVASKDKFTSASDLRTQSRNRSAFSSAYPEYNNPYNFLQKLKEIDGLPSAEYYTYFSKIQYQILNKDGYSVSGGERSEFNLLQEINDAQQYDILLIDEPESSFDNIFLKNEVNKIIKEISKNMPVVLVTHNSTVGASIFPDYIIFTKKEYASGKIEYRTYSGFPCDRELKSLDGKTVKNNDMMLNCLEAGKVAYHERRRMYENLEN